MQNAMIGSVKQILNEQATNIASAMIGALFFVLVYGLNIIDPTNVYWCVYQASDGAQSYLAWEAYRQSDWFFPWGMQNNLAYPSETSSVFTFCAPLLCFIFKLVSPVLPADFQFIGLFGLCSFSLQALFACWIIKLYTNSRIAQVIASSMFLFAPIFIDRWMEHSFIGAHWILLLCIFFMLDYRRYHDNARSVLARWCLMGVISAGVHTYWCLLCGIVLMGYCLADVLTYRRVTTAIAALGSFLCSALLVTWFLGGLSTSLPSVDAHELGIYTMNLNGLINPQGRSAILPSLPSGNGQYEGLAYPGFGFLSLIVLAAILLMVNPVKTREILRMNKELAIAITACLVVAFVIAVSPVVQLGDQIILNIPVTGIFSRFWGIFRACGRAAWIIDYLLMICSLAIVVKFLRRRTLTVVILIALFLQSYDSSARIVAKHDYYLQPIERAIPYSRNHVLQEVMATGNPRHIVYVGGFTWEEMKSLDFWALSNRLSLSDFYFARSYGMLVEENTQRALDAPEDSDIFVFNETSIGECVNYDLNYYMIDDFAIGLTYSLPGFNPMDGTEIGEVFESLRGSS